MISSPFHFVVTRAASKNVLRFTVHSYIIIAKEAIVWQPERKCDGRVEPDVKEQAEGILDQLGIPASVVINALYKQIIYRNGIPFSLILPTAPVARDEMTDAEFHAMMQAGLEDAKADRSRPASEVFAELRRGL